MVKVSVGTSWVVNVALFRCYRPVIYTRPNDRTSQRSSWPKSSDTLETFSFESEL